MNNRRLDPRSVAGSDSAVCWESASASASKSQSVSLSAILSLQIMDGDIAQNIRDTIPWIAHFHTAGVPSLREIVFSQEINYATRGVIAARPFTACEHDWRADSGARSAGAARRKRSRYGL